MKGGLRVILGVCQWTVCLIVVDGLWQTARLTDFVKKGIVHRQPLGGGRSVREF